MTFEEWYEINQAECWSLARENMRDALEFAWGAGNDLEALVERIIEWGHARGIITNGNPQTQCLKLGSEFGELCDNLAKGRYDAAQDDIGDMIVVLIMIATQINTDLGKCLEIAWDDIKERRGYLNVEGIFIKEGDDGQV